MKKTILVTGADGQLGSELREISHRFAAYRFVFTDIGNLDITDPQAVNLLVKSIEPTWVINCAAYTAVDRAESEPLKAYSINSDAVRNIVNALDDGDGKLIHISTDFVFDGKSESPYREESPTNPLSVYGNSKLAVEIEALSYPGSMVIRTSWLYSTYGKNFLKTIRKLAAERESINVVSDQVGTPTYAADLAGAIMEIVSSTDQGLTLFKGGTYHYSNEGRCSWYEFACEIRDMLGLALEIEPVSTSEYLLPAVRPAMSVMDTSRIKKQYHLTIPGWKDSLAICISKLKSIKNGS